MQKAGHGAHACELALQRTDKCVSGRPVSKGNEAENDTAGHLTSSQRQYALTVSVYNVFINISLP